MRTHSVSWAALAIVVASLVALLVGYSDISKIVGDADVSYPPQLVLFAAVGVIFSLAGFLILRRTSNVVGWILQGIGGGFGLIWIGSVLFSLELLGRDLGLVGRLIAAWLGFLWVPAIALLVIVLPLVFPSGRAPSRGWSWVAAAATIAVVGGFAGVTYEALTRPLSEVLADESPTWLLITPLVFVGLVGAVLSVAVRYRRAGVVERLQIKWVSLALILISIVMALSFTQIGALLLGGNLLNQNLLVGSICLIPVSILFAVTRYRLYEIDRLVSRTLSYGLLVGMLLGMYFLVVVGLQTLLAPTNSNLAVAGSTLVVAAAFNPLRLRLQRAVDRQFNRSRYDAAQVVAQAADDLRDSVELAEILRRTEAVVAEILAPVTLSIWVAEKH
jgi:MFS family permease